MPDTQGSQVTLLFIFYSLAPLDKVGQRSPRHLKKALSPGSTLRRASTSNPPQSSRRAFLFTPPVFPCQFRGYRITSQCVISPHPQPADFLARISRLFLSHDSIEFGDSQHREYIFLTLEPQVRHFLLVTLFTYTMLVVRVSSDHASLLLLAMSSSPSSSSPSL